MEEADGKKLKADRDPGVILPFERAYELPENPWGSMLPAHVGRMELTDEQLFRLLEQAECYSGGECIGDMEEEGTLAARLCGLVRTLESAPPNEQFVIDLHAFLERLAKVARSGVASNDLKDLYGAVEAVLRVLFSRWNRGTL